jgi:hypothetical protein
MSLYRPHLSTRPRGEAVALKMPPAALVEVVAAEVGAGGIKVATAIAAVAEEAAEAIIGIDGEVPMVVVVVVAIEEIGRTGGVEDIINAVCKQKSASMFSC